MKTLLDVIKLSTDYLAQRHIANPRRQAEELISDLFGIPRLQLYMDFDRPLTDAELADCRARLQRRGKGEPLQYIHGKVDFLDCTFEVNNFVLIPRPETEILVDKIIKELSKMDTTNKVLWDVCCGPGTIGISVKKKFPDLKVSCSDLSKDALDLAKKNAKLNNVDIEFLEGDLLQPFVGKKADFVVCNPPYISESEYLTLDREVKDYEPRQALVAGPSGLEFYDRLSKDLPKVLNSGGKVWFEMGTGQGKAISELFVGAPWGASRVEQDWSRHDRFFFLEIE